MTWTFFFLMVVLKLPIVAACWLLWYAVKAEPLLDDEEGEDDGGQKVEPHGGSKVPRPPRPRGPHGDPRPPAPARVRVPSKARDAQRS